VENILDDNFRRMVKARMEWLGLNQNDLAFVMGISAGPLSRSLQQGRRCRDKTIHRAFFALGLDVDLLDKEIDLSQILAPHPADGDKPPASRLAGLASSLDDEGRLRFAQSLLDASDGISFRESLAASDASRLETYRDWFLSNWVEEGSPRPRRGPSRRARASKPSKKPAPGGGRGGEKKPGDRAKSKRPAASSSKPSAPPESLPPEKEPVETSASPRGAPARPVDVAAKVGSGSSDSTSGSKRKTVRRPRVAPEL
jgi:hypothetical protein